MIEANRIGRNIFMAKPQFVLEKPHRLRNLILAILGGAIVFILVSELTQGLFPFFEFLIAAIVVYFIARR